MKSYSRIQNQKSTHQVSSHVQMTKPLANRTILQHSKSMYIVKATQVQLNPIHAMSDLIPSTKASANTICDAQRNPTSQDHTCSSLE